MQQLGVLTEEGVFEQDLKEVRKGPHSRPGKSPPVRFCSAPGVRPRTDSRNLILESDFLDMIFPSQAFLFLFV